jgi:hypothetical protein
MDMIFISQRRHAWLGLCSAINPSANDCQIQFISEIDISKKKMRVT